MYSERLLTKGNFLTRLAHSRRYLKTLAFVADVRAAVAVDFGCGDGALLRRAFDQGIIRAGYGIDADPQMRAAAAEVFAGVAGFQFLEPVAAEQAIPPGTCDLAICTETLEHVPDQRKVLDSIVRYCRSGARVIISAPIEIGPSLLGKQLGRYLAGLRGSYGYEKYTVRELLAASLGKPRAFESSHSRDDVELKGHKGFDYRELDASIRERLDVARLTFSPLPMFGKLLNSTAMWECRTR
ncbi:MAG TPA: class I SAM-dependent methyltransferase [Polyangia bacterium]|nr:class I SAM-dependent methyltransferase [Polyangia bacterium]